MRHLGPRFVLATAIVALGFLFSSAPAFAADPGAPEDEVINQFSGGTFFVIGFIAVGIIGAVVAARLAKRSREANDREWRSQDD